MTSREPRLRVGFCTIGRKERSLVEAPGGLLPVASDIFGIGGARWER
jgi:hypothetical protein